MNSSIWRVATSLAVMSLGFCGPVLAQEGIRNLPLSSQAASVTQTVGINEIVVSYHRPGVKERVVWGGLVPYGEVWRAGANENTVISFSQAVRIGGKDLAAGRYGLHMIPTADVWTIAFSRNATSWGSFFYSQDEDALRVTVQPEAAPLQEWLSYSFEEPSDSAVVLALRWEKLRVPIRIDVDASGQTLASIRAQLRGLAGFGWRGRYDAASWCLQNDVNLDEAMTWIDRSLAGSRRTASQIVKAGLLEKQGRADEAQALYDEAIKGGEEAEINNLGYQFLGQGKSEKALQLFSLNLKGHPGSWNAHDSLADALAQKGDRKLAIANYEKALALAPDAQKSRIQAAITALKTP